MKKYNIINNSLGWLCFVIATVTYMLTLEPTASFWDCPEFISQGAKLEVGHPPGNPIWMLTARFFINFAGGDMSMAALMVNAMSALLSAGTILLLFWTITHLVRRIIVKDNASEVSLTKMIVIFGAGLCGALAYTWSDTFWFSAVEGEVYAFSSFCTALVFWLILKWEDRADDPTSDRYLILIAYVIGISIAVHLLNLLCIPAIGLVIYYRKFKDTNAKGSLIALGISCVVVGLILYGLVPGFVEMAQYFELFFVNSCGMGYNMGALIYAIVLVALFIWNIYELYSQKSMTKIKVATCLSIFFSGMPFIGENYAIPVLFMIGVVLYFIFTSKLPIRILNIVVTGILVIFIGYSSYALLLIRANANTPMNQNAPDNVFALSSYLNREQYGQRPLFHGATFGEFVTYQEDPNTGQNVVKYVPASAIMRDESGNAVTTKGRPEYGKVVKTSPEQADKYIIKNYKEDYEEIPEFKMLFPRIYSSDAGHVRAYKDWVNYDADNAKRKIVNMYDSNERGMVAKEVAMPSFTDNLAYFMNYQMNHMYWRYFMWNFAGRQNDIQGNGEVTQGNWISGISFIDNARLGDQSLLPEEFGTGNKGHNVYFLLPLLFGIIGLLWQLFASKRGTEQFWVVTFLFLMTGVAIVLYLNQTPNQPRERDYAFAGSFYAFAIWIGMAVPGIWDGIKSLFTKKAPKNEKIAKEVEQPEDKKSLAIAVVAAILGLIVPIQMVSQTWDDHDRSGRYTARDFGKNYLSSVDKNGIIFVNGDNDTFPLWYAQEVEDYRTDVRVINLSYLATDWYINQMRRPAYESEPVPMIADAETFAYDQRQYGYLISPDSTLTPALKAVGHFYGDSKNAKYNLYEFKYPRMYIPVDADAAVAQNVVSERYKEYINPYISLDMLNEPNTRADGAMNTSKVMSIDIVASAIAEGWKRPVYFAMTVPDKYYLGLTPYMLNTGMAYQVTPVAYNASGDAGVNTEKMYENVTKKFTWGGLDTAEPGSLYLDESVRRMVSTTRSTMLDLATALAQESYMFKVEASEMDTTSAQYAEKMKWANDSENKCREILDLMIAKLPEKACSYSLSMGMDIASLYMTLGEESGNAEDLKKAEAILEREVLKYAEYVRFFQSLEPSKYNLLSRYDMYIDRNIFASCLQSYAQIVDDETMTAMLMKIEALGVNLDRINLSGKDA